MAMSMLSTDPRTLTEQLRQQVRRQTTEFEPLYVQELCALRLKFNSFHYNVLMNSCRKGSWRGAAEWLRSMSREELQPDVCSMNTAISCCKDSSAWRKAILFFRQMPAQSLVTEASGLGAAIAACEKWSIAVSLWSSHGTSMLTQVGCSSVLKAFQLNSFWADAISMLQDMPMMRMQPDVISCSIVGDSQTPWQRATRILHGAPGLQGDDVALSCMARALGCSAWSQALEFAAGGILQRTAALSACSGAAAWGSALLLLTEVDTVAYNVGISACEWQLAISMSHSMASKRITADGTSFNLRIQSFKAVARWEAAVESFQSMKKRSLRQGAFSITSTLSTMSGDTGDVGTRWQQALCCIAGSKETGVQLSSVSYSAMPLLWQQSIDLFRCFQDTWLQLDVQNYASILHSMGRTSRWISAVNCLTRMRRNGIRPDTACYNILTNAGDHWQWVLLMLEETPGVDELSLSAAVSKCDHLDLGQGLLPRYESTQASVSMLWAMARLTVQDPVKIYSSWAQIDTVKLHELPKFCWAVGTLGCGSIQRHLEHIGVSLGQLSMNELQLISWGIAAMGDTPALLMAIQSEVVRRIKETWDHSRVDLSLISTSWIEEIFGVLWACSFAACLSERFRTVTWQLVVEVGHCQDRPSEATPSAGNRSPRSLGPGGTELPGSPSVVFRRVDRMVVSKPPGWEVHDSGTPLQLHTWLSSLGKWPICSDPDADFGFLHRLDVPSSGLILVATTYGAYYDLQFQLRSGMIARNYVTLNHGWFKRRKIDARLYWKGNSATRSGGQGKPSRTRLSKLLALVMPSGNAFSMMMEVVAPLRAAFQRIDGWCPDGLLTVASSAPVAMDVAAPEVLEGKSDNDWLVVLKLEL
eukprot:Skav218927  [mRNA]  locus=scaffold678:20192:24466:+ [translate_table: standard]